jgi:hypothetical protein
MWTTLVDSLAGKIAVCPDTKPARRWPCNPNGNPEALAKGVRVGQERRVKLLQAVRDVLKEHGPISTPEVARLARCHESYALKLMKFDIPEATHEQVKNGQTRVFMWRLKDVADT